jgi:hypothetical protein
MSTLAHLAFEEEGGGLQAGQNLDPDLFREGVIEHARYLGMSEDDFEKYLW